MEKILHTVLDIGLQEPVKLLHVTDVHLVEYNENDPQNQIDHLIRRKEGFRKEAEYPPKTQNEYFEEAFQIGKEEGATVIVTGDVMDVCSQGNIAEFHRITDGKDFMFTPGSHEFAQFCKAPAPNHHEIYADIRPRIERSFSHLNFTFDSRVVGGVNVITLDNSRDVFPAEILPRLKAEAEKGLPMVLFMHDPLSDHGLLRIRAPHPAAQYPEEVYRNSDEIIAFIQNCPLVKASFAGHWHGESEHSAPCGTPVYVTPGLFKGICRLIEIR